MYVDEILSEHSQFELFLVLIEFKRRLGIYTLSFSDQNRGRDVRGGKIRIYTGGKVGKGWKKVDVLLKNL